MADCVCIGSIAVDGQSDAEDVTESTCASATSARGIMRRGSIESLSDFAEWTDLYYYKDSDEEEEEEEEETEETCDENTAGVLSTLLTLECERERVPNVDVYPEGKIRKKADHRSNRSYRMKPQDLKQAIRKAEALRAQLEGHRHRVCAVHNAGPSTIAAGGRRQKARRQKAKVVQHPQWQNFEACRQSLLQQHVKCLQADLMSVPLNENPGWVACKYVEIVPVPLSKDAQSRFMSAVEVAGPRALRMTYHGTNNKNLVSISEKGLLVPGSSSGVGVAHGQSHGQGVYTARLGQVGAALALSFCQSSVQDAVETVPQCTWHAREDPVPGSECARPSIHPGPKDLLLCGVLDDSRPVPPRKIGNHSLTAQSENVSHVGDAIIVARESYIAPMFVARVSQEMLWTRGVHYAGGNRGRSSTVRGRRRLRQSSAKTEVKPRALKERHADVEIAGVHTKLAEEIARTTRVIEKLRESQTAHALEVKRADQRRCRQAARRHKQGEVLRVWCEDWDGGDDH
mmetsp:Transcript_45254/g.104975  ORF Transcript_45254/g.104975 Transcript_45254/m.104975 type:complete len:514 (-) Transcript_45254:205-1746(-)